MKITKLILILITGLAIMGFSTTGYAWVDTPDTYMEEVFEAAGNEGFEATGEDKFVAAPEYEGEPMNEEFVAESESMEEEEYLVDEETVKPVKGEGWDEYDFLPEVY
jgi:hypothetical protein